MLLRYGVCTAFVTVKYCLFAHSLPAVLVALKNGWGTNVGGLQSFLIIGPCWLPLKGFCV